MGGIINWYLLYRRIVGLHYLVFFRCCQLHIGQSVINYSKGGGGVGGEKVSSRNPLFALFSHVLYDSSLHQRKTVGSSLESLLTVLWDGARRVSLRMMQGTPPSRRAEDNVSAVLPWEEQLAWEPRTPPLAWEQYRVLPLDQSSGQNTREHILGNNSGLVSRGGLSRAEWVFSASNYLDSLATRPVKPFIFYVETWKLISVYPSFLYTLLLHYFQNTLIF